MSTKAANPEDVRNLKGQAITKKAPEKTPAPESAELDAADRQAAAQPGHIAPAGVLKLQRTVGNQALMKMMDSRRQPHAVEGVREGPETEPAGEAKALQAKFIQRAAAPEEEEPVQAKLIQRAAGPEEEEPVQTSRASADGAFAAGENFENRLNQTRGGGSPLPEDTQQFMETRFGANFSAVRLHTGTESRQLNRQINAQAFTQGQDIYLGEGKDDVESSEGKHLLAHELTHVVQQTGGAVRRKPGGERVIQRAAKPKTSEKTLKRLTAALEKAVRDDENPRTAADAIYQQNVDYYLKLFRYKLEKHKGKDEDKFKAYRGAFKLEAVVDAWKQRGQFSGLIEEVCRLIPFLPDNADQMAAEDAPAFLRHILVPLKEMSEQASNFLRLLERPAVRNAVKAIDHGATWKMFVDDIPQFAVAEGVQEDIQNQGLHLTAEQIIDRIFDAVIHNRKIDVGYYTNNLTEDSGPVNILKNVTPEEQAARLERHRLDATKPAKPALQCDNLMKVLQKVVEMYPGLSPTFAIGMEPKALLTVELSRLTGGLIPNNFQGNVVDMHGNYTNQIFFTGVTESENPRSHTWNIIDGKPYDSVLGTKGPEVASSISGSFTQKQGKDGYQKVWENGAHTLTQISTMRAAPNEMGFTTAYQRNW